MSEHRFDLLDRGVGDWRYVLQSASVMSDATVLHTKCNGDCSHFNFHEGMWLNECEAYREDQRNHSAWQKRDDGCFGWTAVWVRYGGDRRGDASLDATVFLDRKSVV